MKKVTKILSFVLVLALVLTMSVVLFACNKGTPNNSQNDPVIATGKLPILDFDVQVKDIDGTVIFDKTLYQYEETETLVDILKRDAGAVLNDNNFITSIGGSFAYKPAYIMFSVNGVDSMVGIDGVTLKQGDKFVFRNEPSTWLPDFSGPDATQNSLDVAIYKYVTNVLPVTYLSRTTFKDSNFWLDSIIINMKKLGANVEFTANTEFDKSITNVDYSTLKEAEWGKLYLALVANNKNLDTFKVEYQKALDNLSIETFGPYTTPFFMIPANALGLTSTKLTALIEKTAIAKAPVEFPDGALWTNISIANMKEGVNASVADFAAKFDTYDITNQFCILALCAATKDASSALPFAEKLLAQLDSKGYFKVDADKSIFDVNANFSVNQMYACLVAYRVMFVNTAACNIFG